MPIALGGQLSPSSEIVESGTWLLLFEVHKAHSYEREIPGHMDQVIKVCPKGLRGLTPNVLACPIDVWGEGPTPISPSGGRSAVSPDDSQQKSSIQE